MFLLQLFGAGCLLLGMAAYLRLFLRRSSYASPLDYARALSLCGALDRKLSANGVLPVCWLKCYFNILLPFIGISGGASLFLMLMQGGSLTVSSIIRAAAYLCAFADFLFLRFFDPVAFFVHICACLTAATASLVTSPGGLFIGFFNPFPLLGCVFWLFNLIYAVRRLPLFRPKPAQNAKPAALPEPEPEPPDKTFVWNCPPEPTVTAQSIPSAMPASTAETPSERLERMLAHTAQPPAKRAQKCRPHKIQAAAPPVQTIRIKPLAPMRQAVVTGTLFFGRQERLARCRVGQDVCIRRIAPSEIRVYALTKSGSPGELGTFGCAEREHLFLLLSPGGELRGRIASLTRGEDQLLRCEISYREHQ